MIRSVFLTLVWTFVAGVVIFQLEKSFFVVFCEILWIFGTFFKKYCKLRKIFTYCSWDLPRQPCRTVCKSERTLFFLLLYQFFFVCLFFLFPQIISNFFRTLEVAVLDILYFFSSGKTCAKSLILSKKKLC